MKGHSVDIASLAIDISMDPGSAFNLPHHMDTESCVDYDILFPDYSPHFDLTDSAAENCRIFVVRLYRVKVWLFLRYGAAISPCKCGSRADFCR